MANEFKDLALQKLQAEMGAGAATAASNPYRVPDADYSIWGDIGNFFTGDRTRAENATAAYNQWASEEAGRRFNAEEAQKNRDWQTEMANTAYQRAMADAKKAGINPYYVVGNAGAATGSSASASYGGGKAPNYAGGNGYGKQTADTIKSAIQTAVKVMGILMLA